MSGQNPGGDQVEPTLGEVGRRVDMIYQMLLDQSGKYIERGVYDAHREADTAKVVAIEAEQRRTADWRRQVTLVGGIAAIGWLLTIGIAISNLMAR